MVYVKLFTKLSKIYEYLRSNTIQLHKNFKPHQKRDTHIGIPFSINNYFNYSRRALPVVKFK